MTVTSTESTAAALSEAVEARVARGMRFAGVFAARRDGGITLSAHVAGQGGIDTLEAPLPPGADSYPALTPVIGAAFWYERVIHDETGLVPEGHPRIAPLIALAAPKTTRCAGTSPATACSPSRTGRSAPGSSSRWSTWSRPRARRYRT